MIDLLTEQNLVWYLTGFVQPGEPLWNVKFYTGHDTVDITVIPRCVITCVDMGGALSNSNINKLAVEAIMVSPGSDEVGLLHAKRVSAIKAIFQESEQGNFLAALNAPASGPDPRPQPGCAMSCMAYDEQTGNEDSKDPKKGDLGTRIPFKAVCNLTA